MLADPRVRRVLRDTDRRLPQRLRRAVRLATGRARDLRGTPLVTVVVAGQKGGCSGLDECLHALRAQEHRNLEVIVLLDDPSGPAGAVARRHAQEDWRFRLDQRRHPSVAAARNAGAAAARGSYLTFVRPDDLLPTWSLARLVGSLQTSGSDFAFGRLVEAGGLHRNVAGVPHPAHEVERSGAALHDTPAAVTDTFDENRVYRTSFWRGSQLAFPAAGSSATPALRSFAEATAFDVLVQPTYHRINRGKGRPIGSLDSAMADLDAWLADQAVMRQFLSERDLPEMQEAWALAVCDLEAVPLLDDVERATAEQWQRLREFLTATRETMSEETWRRVRSESRVKIWLALEDRREPLERFVAERLFEFGNRPTRVVHGRVLAAFTGLQGSVLDEGILAGAPADVVEMSERETPLTVHLQGARWLDATRVELEVYAYPRFVSLPEPPELEARIVEPVTGDGLDLEVEPYTDPEANLQGGHRYQDYSSGAARVVVDVDRLPVPAPEAAPTAWRFSFTLRTQGLSRTGTVTSREERASAGLLTSSAHAPRVVAGRLAELRPEPNRGVSLLVGPAPELVVAGARTHGRTVSGALVGGWSGTLVATREGSPVVTAPLVPGRDGTTSFELRLPPVGRRGDQPFVRQWTVRVESEGAEPQPVTFPAGVVGRFLPGTTDAQVAVARAASGHLEVVEASRTLQVSAIALEPDGVRIRGRWVGVPPGAWELRLHTLRATMTVTGRSDRQDLDVVVPTVWDEWGLGPTSVPPGAYQLLVTAPGHPDGEEVRVLVGEELLPGLMRGTVGRDFRLTPLRWPRSTVVRLTPPLTDDERGPFHQRRLQEWSHTLPVDETIAYLQSYTGNSATDSPRAIHDELRRSRPDLTPHWAVTAPSVPVPEGGVPVVMYSREWYRVLGSAKYLVNNIDFDRWFRKKPEQRFLQTFHGYPAKSMGIRLWKAKQFTPRRIELELRRTSRDWDLILTPSPEMDVYYREEYAYDGEIENAGYPRDDALLAPDAPEVRERTRRLLGIAPHQTVVLYAPTWRDDQATNYRSARMTKHLDLESATARLGAEYVFLMRGHRFHAQGTERSGRTARLVDVTDYPEVNDLILASDAAVLDYSSMRFDFALTGRPMLFLVPDLGAYTGGVRGFLYPFEDSAPGPLLDDAEEVVTALQELPMVQQRYAEAYARFQQRYNDLQDGRAARRVVARFFA